MTELFLDVLGEMEAEAKEAKANKGRKAASGDRPVNPAYSSDDFTRLVSNCWLTETSDGGVLIRVANSGARKGKSPAFRLMATEEDVDRWAAMLKAMVNDPELMKRRLEECNEIAAKRK